MRLTLRTLLAYLDDVLDPVDKEELAQKIQSSEFAEDLVHRTRDTVPPPAARRPQIIGTGMGLDPNTVAEYLDNVMPPEQVGDFERICLESDVHLAEATACHHVLTMVLGEPPTSIRSPASGCIRSSPTRPTASAFALSPRIPRRLHSPLRRRIRPRLRCLLLRRIYQRRSARTSWRCPIIFALAPGGVRPAAIVGLAALLLIGISIVFATGLRGWLSGKQSVESVTAQERCSS